MDWYVVRKRSSDEGFVPVKTPLRKNRPWFFIALFIVVVLALVGGGYAWAKKEVTLSVDGKTASVSTFQMTVKGLLQQQHVQMGPKDVVQPGLDTPLREGMQVKVVRALRVTLIIEGKTLPVLTQAKTVSELLNQEKVLLGREDIVSPDLDSRLSNGTTVRIIRVSRRVEERQTKIPFSTKRKPTSTLYKGQTKVLVAGEDGLATERWEIVYHDGKEKERRLVERKVTKSPVDRVVAVGILQTISRGGSELRFTRVLTMRASAYTYTGRNTASGTVPRLGTAAVDPNVIPFGTRLYVEGYGYAIALDQGSSILGDRIDLFFPSWAEAMAWGVRTTKVYVLQ